MCSSSEIKNDEMEATNCVGQLTKHEESLNRFLCELEIREQNFTESLKKINDTLETLVNVNSPEIPEFLLRVPSKHISKKKKIRKRSRSKNQCVDDCTGELNVFNAIKKSQISEAMDLKDLAKKFEKFLKKAKKHGLSRLVEPIKESARRLRELSQVECSCEVENNLDTDQQENEGSTNCDCNDQSDTNLKKRSKDTRKKRKYHKDEKDEKNRKICPDGMIADYCDCSQDVNICEEGKISENCDCSEEINICEEEKMAENCDCSEEKSIDTLKYEEKKSVDHLIVSISSTHKVLSKREISKSCEDLSFRQCQIDPECMKNDLCILRTLLENLTAIGNLVIDRDRDRDKEDWEISRSMRDRSMIDNHKLEKIIVLKNGCTNVKDEECQCVGDGKESGRTMRSMKKLKDHTTNDEDAASHDFNAKRCQTSCSSSREASRIDDREKSQLAEEIVFLRGTFRDDLQSDSEENLTCPCGCGEVGEISDQHHSGCCEDMKKSEKNIVQSISVINDSLKKICPCGCADMSQIKDSEMSETRDENLFSNKHKENMYQEKEEDIEELLEKLKKKIYSIQAKNDELKKLMKTCYCDDDVDKILTLQGSEPPRIRATRSGLTAAIEVLQSKCHSKDRMINALASELQGSKDIDQIAKNLTAPCLQFTYWDFDQCNLYSYLRKPKPLNSNPKVHEKDDKSVIEKSEEKSKEIYQTAKPTNFRVVREICNCLLVAWNIPKNIRGLRGYEIVLNSKVVAARVKNPTRTETVLGPFDLSESADFPGSIILTLYAIDAHGKYSEPTTIRF